jgi:phosphotransferase system HPr (HPr) family protein
MSLSKELIVKNKAGFHLRVASMICKTAMKYEAKIALSRGAYVADCRSILDLLSLGAPCGERLTLTVDGEDAEDALREIELLFERKFYEDEFADVEPNE